MKTTISNEIQLEIFALDTGVTIKTTIENVIDIPEELITMRPFQVC